MKKWIGVDIGGTKIAVVFGNETGQIIEKSVTDTKKFFKWEEAVEWIATDINAKKDKDTKAIGISCGGPLNSKKGIIMSPPNLPGWDDVPIKDILADKCNLPVFLENDANACALAEYKYGAGKELQNLVFATFGTGLGAGLILNGKLYTGKNSNAGEIGHFRLQNFGPTGFGKMGSFEGFCSGGGIAQLGRTMILEWVQSGKKTQIAESLKEFNEVTAFRIAECAKQGDECAKKIYAEVGRQLGYGLALVMDMLNPDIIIIGSIFMRCEEWIRHTMDEVLVQEALISNRCPVVAAALGESLGDVAALSVAQNGEIMDE